MNRNFLTWLLVNILFGLLVYHACSLRPASFLRRGASEVTLLIVALFLVFWIKNVIDTISFLRFFSSTRHLANRVIVQTDPLSLNHSLRGHVGRFFFHLQEKARNSFGARTSADELLASLEARLHQQRTLVAVGSTLLITLGLIGTVYGLIQAMAGLETVTSSLGEQGGNLVDGMTHALSGMSTAFYTTLFGAVLGGLFLRMLCLFSDRLIGDGMYGLSIFCEVHVVPRFNQSAGVELAKLHQDARHLTTEIHKLVRDLAEAGRGIVDQHGNAARVLERQYQDLGNQVLAHCKMLANAVDSQAKTVQLSEQLLEQVVAGSESLKASTVQLSKATAKITKALSSVEEATRLASDGFVKHTNDLFRRLESRAVVSALRDLGAKFDRANRRRRPSK